MRAAASIAVAAAAILATAGAAAAAETDQYLAWGVDLADSSAPINRFLNRRFEAKLERLARSGRARPCEAIPGRLYDDLFASIASSRLRRFLHESPEVDLYPPREVGYWDYRSRSVFRRIAFPGLLPMARTVRVGDVYLGTDKLSHMFGFGRRYHRRYQRLRRRDLPTQEALRQTVLWGLEIERNFVGGLTDGIVSLGDLEANFQGLRLAREMCEGEDPYLVRRGGGWRLARPIDLGDYVNPGFDESYYPNVYLSYRWRLVRPILLAEYCPRFAAGEVRRRWARYREIDELSFGRRVVAEYYAQRAARSPESFTMEEVCALTPRSPARSGRGTPGRPRRRSRGRSAG